MMRRICWVGMVLVLLGCSRPALRCDGTLQPINAGASPTATAVQRATIQGLVP
jgi:hypothetical protein